MIGVCVEFENIPVGMNFTRVQEDALAVNEKRVFVPSYLQDKAVRVCVTSASVYCIPQLTISCSASLLYGLIQSLGEVYPTALAALPTARHPSASALPSFLKLFISTQQSNQRVERWWLQASQQLGRVLLSQYTFNFLPDIGKKLGQQTCICGLSDHASFLADNDSMYFPSRANMFRT